MENQRMSNNLGSYSSCPDCGKQMICTPVADSCSHCGYYVYYGGSARTKVVITAIIAIFIILWTIALVGCSPQPLHTTYKQPLVRGWNGRWVKAGEKELCEQPCTVLLVDFKNYEGDTVWLYSKRP